MHLLDRSKFGANLNPFELNLIRFKTESGGTVLPGPRASAAPRHLALPHSATAHRAPVSSRPTCQPLRLTSLTPAASPVAAMPAAVRAAQSHRTRTVLAHAALHPGPSLSTPILPPRGTEPTPLLFPLRTAPERVQKRRSLSRSPLRSTSSHPRQNTSPPPPSTLNSVYQPRMPGSLWPPTHFRPPPS
jgi:hypothetical protein